MEERIEKYLDGIRRAVKRRLNTAQNRLIRIVLELLEGMDVTDGIIRNTANNIAKLTLLDNLFDLFTMQEMNEVTRFFGTQLMGVTELNADYYILAGFDEQKVRAAAADVRLIRAKLGLDESGGLVKGGYLDSLAKSPLIKRDIKDAIIQGIVSGRGLRDIIAGLKTIVQGKKGVDGRLIRYWNQYAYDTPNQIREIHNLHVANELELNYFIYTGGLIAESRAFCIKRNGKVFHRNDTKSWKDDPDLIDKKTKSTYNPLIDRGRYNCRHFLMWISDETALELLEKQNNE